jgi:hypothetical protein
LRAAPPRLRYVFIELSYFRANFSGQGADTIRSAYWHDGERTRAVWRQLARTDWARIKPLRKRRKPRWPGWIDDVSACADLFAEHGRLFLQRVANLGRGAAWLRIATGVRAPNDALAPLGPARDGFIPSDDVMSGPTLAEFQRQVAALKSPPLRERVLDEVPQEALETMLAKIRARGAEPILFIAPTTAGTVFLPRRAVAPLFDFSDPQQWPALFDPQLRADIAHLNTAGAEVFTRALAERFFAVAKVPAEQR